MVGDTGLFSVVYEYPPSLSSDDVDDDVEDEDGLMAGEGTAGGLCGPEKEGTCIID